MIFDLLTGLSWILVPILTTLTAINLATARTIRPKNVDSINSTVAILIPMRNEAANVHEVLDSATKQEEIAELKILVLDDQSTDETGTLLAAQNDPRIQTFRGEDLPQGWLGKNFASHQIASRSDAEYLVFIDADVRLSPHATASSIAMMNQLNLDFLSPYPRQIAIS
ncbi:MAG: glycosyltransferase, partial [Actinobacteria bacterium]|nr:glycosyltransferase [Actinomycetota bacterium]